MTYCHRGTKGRKGQTIIFRLAIIQRYCLCSCVLTIYLKKIVLSSGASYGDKCVTTSLLLEIPRKIFEDWEDRTVHACTGCGRVMLHAEPVVLLWAAGRGCYSKGQASPGCWAGDLQVGQRGAWGIGDIWVLAPPEAQMFLSRWCTGYSFGSNG